MATPVTVPEFYRNRSLFITGGTGFMGKVLLEKLLRSCPDIKNVYLLMRPKKGQDVATRLTQLLNSPLFDAVRAEQPQAVNKVIPIYGDVTEPELGISPSDQKVLIDNVSVVFHSAATVKFDEALKLSVTINMLGTKQLVALCHRMMSLEALVHVSTAYCNCDREQVNEIIYPPPYDPEKIIQCMDWMDEELVNVITPHLIGKRPNTYTFTKALAEHMLLKESGNLPVAIVRPSIVLSAYREPLRGWVDGWNGPTGVIAAAGKGIFRTMLCNGSMVADLVPVDLVINLLVCVAWHTATTRPDGIKVYNCTTGMQRPITWKDFVGNCFHYFHKHPLRDTIWYPDGTCSTNWLLNMVGETMMHIIPAYTMDGVSKMCGQKAYMVRTHEKLKKAAECLEYFSTHQWQFTNTNVVALQDRLCIEDRREFSFDVKEIQWQSYIENYVLGIRRFIFKDPPDTLCAARKNLQWLYLLHRCVQVLGVVLAWRLVMLRSSTARSVWLSLLGVLLRFARMVPTHI
ncbi:putative fatty acyl-CoA reductase CG5065 [Cloeon dipterum]|uniref:putative fatty acyl-CoA reductase CG5065 n=1 Tax=Cloeon dipterum TaxID=197152 RepID=UPI00321F9858